MAFNTGNPLGSTDPRDFSDNSENLDRAVNNAASATWTDRFGNSRTTLAGQIGYRGTGTNGAIESYAAGLVLESFSTVILYDGQFYKPSASAILPYTTTATLPPADTNLVGAGDAVLRQDLAGNLSVGDGAALVNGATIYVGSVAGLEALSLPVGTNVYLTEEGRAGSGVIKSGTAPTDPQKGVNIVLANGNYWMRRYDSLTGNGGLNPLWFGAKGDGSTDDTAAIQAAIDYANLDGKVTFREGVFMATSLSIDTGIQLQGSGSGVTYIKQVAGQTVPLLQDVTSGQNILLYDMSFDGNNNTIADGIVNLGFQGVQFGTVAMMKNLYVRNVSGPGVKVNGNVAQFDTLELVNCTIGMDLQGVGNLATNIITANCSDIGLNIQGARNTVRGIYGEGSTSTAIVNIANDSVGTTLSDINGTGIGANTHGAILKIGTGCWLTEVQGIRASVTSAANLLNGLIWDQTGGTRKIYGQEFAGQFYSVPRYNTGARTQLYYISSTPPTTGQHLSGDWFIGGAGAPGFPVQWICTEAGSPGTWEPIGVTNGAIAKTADETLTTADNGKRFSNSGAAATVTLTLPAAFEGARYYFTRRSTTEALRIEPGGSFLAGGGFGKYVQLDSDGASIQIEFLTTNTYVITSQSGSISFEP